ncbi:hypothetical protein KKE06_00800 [Candidatus Micrarchaeota archaeon]|nr:hypothetical protein [Candidatus Micrarchaeota archaeon]MBU1930145.1 hypothetical protein [Candidatus Micrarchaeota archaeon]
MVFFKALLIGGQICVALALFFLFLGTIGVHLFAGTVNTIPGMVLFFMLAVFFVIWVKY